MSSRRRVLMNTEIVLAAVQCSRLKMVLSEMYGYEQALGSPGTMYHFPLEQPEAKLLLEQQLISRTPDGRRVQLTWQGRKFVRDHL